MKLAELLNRDELREPLYKNSVYLMLTSVLSAIFGFVFWVIVARQYSKQEMGIAVGLVSLMSLALLLSRFGVDQSLIRFLPERNKGKVFWTSVIITTLFIVVIGVLMILVVGKIAPDLAIVGDYSSVFIAVLIVSSISTMAGQAFIALRKSRLFLVQNIILQSRLFFVTLFASLGAIGIFGSWGLSLVVSVVLSLFLLSKSGISFSRVDRAYFRESLSYSFDNYIVNLLIAAPSMLLPIMVIGTMRAEDAANYYLAFALAQGLFIVPGAFSTSILVEGSHGEPLRRIVKRSFKTIMALLSFLVIAVFLLGDVVLGFIGQSYLEASSLLRLFALSSFFMIAHSIYFSVKRVQRKTRILIFLSAISLVVILPLSQILMIEYGLVGLGYAWLADFALITTLTVVLLEREGWLIRQH